MQLDFDRGGFNATDAFGDRYDSEETKNLEVGFKATFDDGRYSLNGSLYTIDYTNQQFFVFGATSGQALTNLDSSSVEGLEIEFMGRLTENLDLSVGYSVADATIDEFGSFEGTDINTDLLDPEKINGNDLNYSPEYTFNVGLQWRQSLSSDLDMIARADYMKSGRVWWFVDNVESPGSLRPVKSAIDLGKPGRVTGLLAHLRRMLPTKITILMPLSVALSVQGPVSTQPGVVNPVKRGVEFSYRF